MIFPGAPSALRGYRLQHLYSLFRILNDSRYEFQLEGTEDLEIFDAAGRLVEAIQVKARSSTPLTPSALTTNAGTSFFRRALERIERYPDSKQRVISFGEVGPVLKALQRNGDATTAEQIDLLGRVGLPAEHIDAFRAAFDVERVEEQEIERRVMARLAEMATVGNPQVAFLYLSGWMYRQMEDRRKLTVGDVRDKLLAVGRFITEAHAHAAEWFTTIVPLEEQAIDENRRDQLVRDFYDGVSARFEHIVANIDVVRAGKLTEIEAAFAKSRVVLVHGASGQGKTALASRHLLTADPSAWRFLVRELQDIPHARRVALALRSHADAIGVPMIVWIDVSPQDTAWTRVVEDLEPLVNTRVLVTIREEDWTRARNAGATLRYAEINLTLDQSEARHIFDGLQQYRISPEFLDFNDAWRQFGAGGPLMEFTYLVTRGDALATTLDRQVRRLREEVRTGSMLPAEVELLRRVAVGTAAGGRVRLAHVIADLSLPDAKTSLDRFEREYLLRVSPDALTAEGLHPLRSGTIARLLTQDALDPGWLDTAIAIMPAVDESDLEAFLLSLFSQAIDHNRLKAAVAGFRPTTWSGAAGIVRALLWYGMHDYASENAELINDVVEQKKGSEFALAVLDPAGLQTFTPELEELLDNIFSITSETQAWYEDVKARKPSSDSVTREASAWLRDAGPAFGHPKSASDWAGLAEVLFWCAAWDLASAATGAAAIDYLARGANEITLDAAADVMFALSFWDGNLLPDTIEAARRSLLERFQLEMLVFALDRKEQTTTAHYVSPLDASHNLHEETIHRLDIMRRLLSTDAAFGAQAYGHIFGSELFALDPSTKKAVPRGSFPVPWAVRLSRLFSFIARVQMRGASWGTYTDTIASLRRRLTTLADATTEGLRKYFNKAKPRNIFELGVEKLEWYEVSVALNDLPRLPATSVDAWGVELRERSETLGIDTPSEHADWEKALHEYTRAFHDFLETSTPYFLANCHVGRPDSGSSEAIARAMSEIDFKAHRATHHLAEAFRALSRVQREFRSRFGRFCDAVALSQLEDDEQNRLWTMWAVWYQFAERPKQHFADARRESLAAVAAVLKLRRAALKRRLDAISAAQVLIHHEGSVNRQPKGLWITMNVELSGDHYLALDATLPQIIEALRPPADLEAF